MLVTFKTNAYGDITMFGDIAVRLLRMMGHSGTVPSAIAAEDIPAAIDKLKAALEKEQEVNEADQDTDAKDGDDDDDEETPVSLAHRALPLIELLEAAGRENEAVMWDT